MKNKLLLTSMSTILGLYGLLIFFLLIVFNLAGIGLEYLVISSIVILALQFIFSPMLMDLTMKWFYKADFNMTMPEYLQNFISASCQRNKMKYPKIGIIDDGAPNAFTYGRTKNDARILLTRGVFELLSEEEVKAVVAHELGHAVHYDMFLMTAAQLVPLVLYYIYDATFKSSSNDDNNGKTAIIGVIAYGLYIVSEYVILWFSRTREYYADEFSALETQNPNALASALVKIGYGLTTQKNTDTKTKNSSSVTALGIFDTKTSKALVVSSYDDGEISKENIKKAARWELWNPWAKWYEFNSTHPLISKRIKSICKYCAQFNQVELIKFDEQKPESYVDDFAVELVMRYFPLIIVIAFFVICFAFNYIVTDPILFAALMFVLFSFSLFIPFLYSHKIRNFKNKKIDELLAEVKVSGVNSIPCVVTGTVIGKGDPGNIFSEDFIIKDETGIMLVDYNQPFAIFNTLFALLKSKKYINQQVTIKGWYRRAPVPYIEILSITMDGKTKNCFTFALNLLSIGVLCAISIIVLLNVIM